MNRYRCTFRDPRQPDAPWQHVVVQAETAMAAARTLENLSLEVMNIVIEVTDIVQVDAAQSS